MLRGWTFIFALGVALQANPGLAAPPRLEACSALLEAHLYEGRTVSASNVTHSVTEIPAAENVQLNLSLKDRKATFKPKKVLAAEKPLAPADQAFEHGLYFWLVKGVSRLPHPPRKKNVVENGYVDVAVPLIPGDPESDLVIFHYRALNQQDGTRSAVLKSFSVSDASGRELGKRSATAFFNELASVTTRQSHAELKHKGHRIPFPISITDDVFQMYHHFFVTFYYNPSQRDGYLRKLEDLYDVETLAQLERRRRHFHRQNMRRWVMERFARYAVVHLALIASTPLWIDKLPGSQVIFRDPQPVIAESVPPALAQVTGPTSLLYFHDGEPVEVFVLNNHAGQYSLLLSPAHWNKVDQNNQILLTDQDGEIQNFFVVALSDGNKALIRLADSQE